MKISFIEKIQINSNDKNTASRYEDKKAKDYFKILLNVFSVTVFIMSIFILGIDKKIIKNENSVDYVSVFKESDLYEILFDENK